MHPNLFQIQLEQVKGQTKSKINDIRTITHNENIHMNAKQVQNSNF